MAEQLVEIVQVNGVDKVKFFCPICDQKLRVGLDMSGKKVECVGCATIVDVPQVRRSLLSRIFRH
jgi:hypothetical protein